MIVTDDGFSFGRVIRSRRVDKAWQYEAFVSFASCSCSKCQAEGEWIPWRYLHIVRSK